MTDKIVTIKPGKGSLFKAMLEKYIEASDRICMKDEWWKDPIYEPKSVSMIEITIKSDE